MRLSIKILHYDSQNNGTHDNQYSNTHHNDTLHNDTKPNKTQLNDTKLDNHSPFQNNKKTTFDWAEKACQ